MLAIAGKVTQLARLKSETESNLLDRVLQCLALTLCPTAIRCLFAISSNLFIFVFIFCCARLSSCGIFSSVEFHLPKSQKKEAENAISPSQRRISSFSCVRFFKFPSKHNKKRPREEKKQQFYNLGGPGYMCAAKKCSERFQGFLNMKKS